MIFPIESYQIFPVSVGVTGAAFPAATHAAFAAAGVQEKLWSLATTCAAAAFTEL